MPSKHVLNDICHKVILMQLCKPEHHTALGHLSFLLYCTLTAIDNFFIPLCKNKNASILVERLRKGTG